MNPCATQIHIEEHEFEKLTSYQYHNMMERLKADLIAQ